MGTTFWDKMLRLRRQVDAFVRRFVHIIKPQKHSIYTRCMDCKTFGIGYEHDCFCGNCGSQNTIEYYPCGKA